jgi:hypothetical protein
MKNELKNELKSIFYNNQEIDKKIVEIKVAIHNLEKLGINTRDLEKQLDNVGIEFYKFKNNTKDFIKEKTR